jgi:predicted permease
MNWLTNLTTGLKSLLNKQRVDREIDEELESYLEASAADKRNVGMTPEAARRAALVELGSRNSVKHQVWSSRWESTFDSLLQDMRLSFRTLAKSPGFTAVALLSLALGIGANTAIFTLIHQVLLQDLPVHDPEQLVTFGNSDSGGVIGGVDLGYYGMFPWYFARQFEADPGPFQGIAAFGSFSDKVSIRPSSTNPGQRSESPAILAPANLVSGNYFSVLGAQPLLGRAIAPSDDATPGTGAVVVLSYHFWQQSLASDPAILDKSLTINGAPFAVIGVMPKTFQGIKLELEPTALWTPISMQSVIFQQPSLLTPQSGPYFLHLFGRLSAQATTNKADLAQSQSWLDQQIHAGVRASEGTTITATRQQEINRETVPLTAANNGVSSVRNQYGDSLQILMAVVALVLLIACANLANFLLARAATRQREIATRLALGSSRGRIVRQSLIETVILSLSGGFLGLGIAFAATRTLIAFVSRGNLTLVMNPMPDLTVLLFTLVVSLAAAFLFGLAPALTAARTSASSTLSASSRTAQSSGGKSSRFWPKTLVTAQVMLSLLLLVGAGLFLRTLRNLQNQDYGFERTHLLLAQFNARLAGYKPSQTPTLHERLIERLSALPGVRSAALAATPPISPGAWSSTVTLSGYTPAPKENMVSILNRVSGRYFETAGIPIVAGRPITPADSGSSLKVAVVNQTLANHFYPRGDALGHSLSIDIDSVKGPWQIVGIARDTRFRSPRDTSPMRLTYIPLAQIEPFRPVPPDAALDKALPAAAPEENQDRFANTILIRTTSDPARTVSDLRSAVAAIDPNLPLLEITTMHEQVSNLISRDELISTLTTLFALLALLLAAIGLFGVMSYNVVRRTNEIGIRLALGAQAPAVLWMILRESFLLLTIGVALGLPLTVAATRIIKEQLFGLTATDLVSFASAITGVSLMTLFAAWLPARRAAHVDPMEALRCD